MIKKDYYETPEVEFLEYSIPKRDIVTTSDSDLGDGPDYNFPG